MIYLDNLATTPVDPQVVDAMSIAMREHFANPSSRSHLLGHRANEAVEYWTEQIARCIGAEQDEVLFTSGATESNNLAILGYCLRPRQRRRKIISLVSEHHAVLDPFQRLTAHGFEVVLLPIHPQTSNTPGMIDEEAFISALDEETALVSIMLANNEIGVIQPIEKLASKCHQIGAVLHCDATQAVGKLPIQVDELGVDLMSFSAHKFYGPKGIGGLFVRRRQRPIRIQAQIVGGGQQQNLRSGTLNLPGIVGMGVAMRLCEDFQKQNESARLSDLVDKLYSQLRAELPDLRINGPTLGNPTTRLAGNLNCCFLPIEGQSLMLEVPQLAISSGSACSSTNPKASHVLRALGLSEEEARCSLRFGVGRFNSLPEIEQAAELLINAVRKLRKIL
ncbi:MAG: cysteine desulfurase [Planctomycetales bacterium]|nr:cysteine desulfurase [Planctomycetales bacterium]